jgi:hypothetical protein
MALHIWFTRRYFRDQLRISPGNERYDYYKIIKKGAFVVGDPPIQAGVTT